MTALSLIYVPLSERALRMVSKGVLIGMVYDWACSRAHEQAEHSGGVVLVGPAQLIRNDEQTLLAFPVVRDA